MSHAQWCREHGEQIMKYCEKTPETYRQMYRVSEFAEGKPYLSQFSDNAVRYIMKLDSGFQKELLTELESRHISHQIVMEKRTRKIPFRCSVPELEAIKEELWRRWKSPEQPESTPATAMEKTESTTEDKDGKNVPEISGTENQTVTQTGETVSEDDRELNHLQNELREYKDDMQYIEEKIKEENERHDEEIKTLESAKSSTLWHIKETEDKIKELEKIKQEKNPVQDKSTPKKGKKTKKEVT